MRDEVSVKLLENFKHNFDCVVCLEQLKSDVVTLNCTQQHKICLVCAKTLFGEMKDGQIPVAKECPFRCTKLVSAYNKELFFPQLVNNANLNHGLDYFADLQCQRCDEFLEDRRVVTLDCPVQHKMCLICAQMLFKEGKSGAPLKCILCDEPVTKYVNEFFVQRLAEEARRIEKLKDKEPMFPEEYTKPKDKEKLDNEDIKWRIYANWRRVNGRMPFFII